MTELKEMEEWWSVNKLMWDRLAAAAIIRERPADIRYAGEARAFFAKLSHQAYKISGTYEARFRNMSGQIAVYYVISEIVHVKT